MATWTLTQRTELAAAIAGGVREVSYSGPPARRVVYGSQQEMLTLLALMDRDLGLTDTARKTGYLSVDRGL